MSYLTIFSSFQILTGRVLYEIIISCCSFIIIRVKFEISLSSLSMLLTLQATVSPYIFCSSQLPLIILAETDTLFNGRTAFPKSSTIVTGLKYKKKYPGHKQPPPIC